MEVVRNIRGRVMPLNRADVDTDQIIPAKYLKRIERSGFGRFAFEEWRKDPSFVTNDRRYDSSPILVTGPNFGCGSSREHAPWALQDMGLRAIIAPSFADIFRNNCAKIGLLTVVLPQPDVDQIVARAEDAPGFEAEVDLESQTVRFGSEVRGFHIDAFVKHSLLNGLDEIGLTLQDSGAIDSFETSRPHYKPRTIAAH
ncbi:MAG: 3-isopropylmalate dehydratase small subunit [Dehalococcoidia bacterium]